MQPRNFRCKKPLPTLRSVGRDEGNEWRNAYTMQPAL
jgi:hypothetical protein